MAITSFTKTSSGSWGVRVRDGVSQIDHILCALRAGKEVAATVSKRDGSSKTVVLNGVDSFGATFIVATIKAAPRAAPRAARKSCRRSYRSSDRGYNPRSGSMWTTDDQDDEDRSWGRGRWAPGGGGGYR